MARDYKAGRKHKILFYRHSMDRIWRSLVLLSLVLWIVWLFAPYIPPVMPPNDWPIEYSGYASLGLIVIFFLLRNRAYIQARKDHIRIAFPLTRVKIPYNLIETTRTLEFKMIFDNFSALSWSQKRFLKPYYGTTLSVIFMKRYPFSLELMKLFLPNYVFLPHDIGFLFLIKDWLKFNTEVDSRYAEFKSSNLYEGDEAEGIGAFYGEKK